MLAWKGHRESANFLHGPDLTSVSASLYVKWPHSACSGIYTHDMERLRPMPKHTLGFHKILMERKSVDCYKHIPYDCKMPVLNSKTYQKQGHRWLVNFHCKALIRTEVCQDNTAFMVNFFRDHSKKQDKVHRVIINALHWVLFAEIKYHSCS